MQALRNASFLARLALAWFALQIPPPDAQWMAMPTKSVCAFARAAVPPAEI